MSLAVPKRRRTRGRWIVLCCLLSVLFPWMPTQANRRLHAEEAVAVTVRGQNVSQVSSASEGFKSPWLRLLLVVIWAAMTSFVCFQGLFAWLLGSRDVWPRPAFGLTLTVIWSVTAAMALILFWDDLYTWSVALFQKRGAWEPIVLRVAAVIACVVQAFVPLILYRRTKPA